MNGAIVLVLIIVFSAGGGILRRKASDWGAKKGMEYAANRSSGTTSVELGTALWFPDANTAYPLVKGIISKPMMVEEINPNLWHKAETAPDSLQISWEPNGPGAYLLIRRAKAHLTKLVGIRWWSKSLDQIEKQAAQQGIQVTRVAGQLQHTSNDGEHRVYTR